MGDYLDFDESTLGEDLDLDESLVDEEIEEMEEAEGLTSVEKALPNNKLIESQGKVTSREDVYGKLYDYGSYKTGDMLTKYEKARIIGLRAQQIIGGAPTLVDVGDLKDSIKIAEKELAERKLPYIIERLWPSKDLKKPNSEYRRVAELHQ